MPIVKGDERTYNGIIRPEYTPDAISSLKSDEIFVFGSNLHGYHGGGAARAACKKFGAIWGQGVGLQGQSYAIPTMQGGVETIKPYVDQFIEFAKAAFRVIILPEKLPVELRGHHACTLPYLPASIQV